MTTFGFIIVVFSYCHHHRLTTHSLNQRASPAKLTNVITTGSCHCSGFCKTLQVTLSSLLTALAFLIWILFCTCKLLNYTLLGIRVNPRIFIVTEKGKVRATNRTSSLSSCWLSCFSGNRHFYFRTEVCFKF